MKTYIALFRGINVGGKNTLPMRELVVILEDLGARKVKTYIQSGNAVFVCKDKDTVQLAHQIRAEITKRRGRPSDVDEPGPGHTWQRAPLVLPRRRFRYVAERARALVARLEEEPHVNPNTRTQEFALRDP